MNAVRPNLAFAQRYDSYYRTIIEAETLEAGKEYNAAFQKYQKAINALYPFPDDVLNAIRCCLKSDFKEEAPVLVKKLVRCGFKKEMSEIFISHMGKKGNVAESNGRFPFPELKAYLDSVYTETRTEYLEGIRTRPNTLLSTFNIFEFFTRTLRLNRGQYAPEMKVDDLQNLCWLTSWKLFKEILKSGTDIRRSFTDTWGDDDFIACLIHMAQTVIDTVYEKEFFDLMWEMVLEGNLHPAQFAGIKDGALGRKTKKSCLGLFFVYDAKLQKLQIKELEDPQHIDAVRSGYFLPPLWVQAELKGQVLPRNYKYQK